ncbi:type VI secretion system tube protein Hcp, partial [Cyanobium sp. Tous-M-B4]
MTQLLLSGTSLSASTSSYLEQALQLLEARLAAWVSNTNSYNALLLQVFGAQSSETTADLQTLLSGTGLTINLEILPATSLNGSYAAYTSSDPTGAERIYLNATWLESATAEQIEAVLLEELGHAIDIRLNGSADTAGDEGAIFSALLRDVTPAPAAYSENDQSVISIAGNSVPVEAAGIASEYKYFLRIDGIAGNSTVSGYEGWFEINSHDFDATAAAGTTDFAPLLVDVFNSPALSFLYQQITEGIPIASLQIQGVIVSTDTRLPIDITYELRLADVVITGLDNTSVAGDQQSMQLSFVGSQFGISTTPLNADGSLGSASTYAFDIETSRQIIFGDLPQPDPLPNAGFSARIRYFLRIDGIAGNSTTSGYEGWFEIDRHDFDAASAAGSLADFSPLRVDLRNAPSLRPFYQLISTGTSINSLQIRGVYDSFNEGDLTPTTSIVYELRLAGAVITGLDNTNVAGDQQALQLSFVGSKFGISSTPINADRSLGTAATYAFDFEINDSIGFSSLPEPGSLSNARISPVDRYFLKIDGIAGNSTVSRYEGWFEIEAHDFDVTKVTTTSNPEFSPLRIDLLDTPSLSFLYERIAEGSRIDSLQIHGVKDLVGGTTVKTYELRLADAAITGLDNTNFAGDQQVMQLAFVAKKFGISTTPLNTDGTIGRESAYAFDIPSNQQITFSDLPTPASLPIAGNSPVDLYFLNIDGIAGNSTARGYEGWFEINSHDFDVTGALLARPEFSPLRVDFFSNSSINLLYERIAEGSRIDSVQIHGVKVAGGSTVKTYELRLANAVITGLDNTNVAGDPPAMQLSFVGNKFGISTTPLNADGSTGTAATYAFDIPSKLETNFSNLPAPALPSNAGDFFATSYFLKIDGIAGNSTVSGYQGWFEIDSHDFDAVNQVSRNIVSGALEAGLASFSSLRVDLLDTPSLSLLYQRIAEGGTISSLQIHGVKNNFESGNTSATYELRLADAILTGLDNTNVAGDQQSMQLSFVGSKFGISTTPLNDDGSLGLAATYAFDIANNRSIDFGDLPTPANQPNAGVSPIDRYFLSIDGIAGNSTVSGYEGWFQINNHDFDVTRAGSAVADFSPLRIDLPDAPSLSLLYERIVEGGRINGLQIHGVSNLDVSRIIKTYELSFDDAFITGLDTENVAGKQPAMRLSFDVGSFTVSTTPLSENGILGATSTYNYTDEAVDGEATGTLAINGSAQEGGTLMALTSAISDPDGQISSFRYQWQVSANGTTGWGNIGSATGSSFSIAADQTLVGKFIRLNATSTDSFGGTTDFSSAATAAVANVEDEATGTLAITGNPQEGATLSADISAVTDPDGNVTYSYQWQVSANGIDGWSNIDSATGSSFSIAADQTLVGKFIRLNATSTDSFGGNTDFSSAATAAVVNIAPSISQVASTTANGTYSIGDVITLIVQFSETVLVDITSGTPQLQLETGDIDRFATYSSGSGTGILSFQYTVQAGDSSADLDQLFSSALQLNGGTIRDISGNNAILTLAAPGATGSLGANAALVIDGTNDNDNPVVLSDNNTDANSVAENAAIGTAVGITAFATDADSGATITAYSLTNSAGGLFSIDANGVVKVAAALDFEAANSHSITVKAVSSDGSENTETFSIAVTKAVEANAFPTKYYLLIDGLNGGSTEVNHRGWFEIDTLQFGAGVGVSSPPFREVSDPSFSELS